MDGWGVPKNGEAMEEWQGGEWLEKSIRVGQGTEKSSIGSSLLEDKELLTLH